MLNIQDDLDELSGFLDSFNLRQPTKIWKDCLSKNGIWSDFCGELGCLWYAARFFVKFNDQGITVVRKSVSRNVNVR